MGPDVTTTMADAKTLEDLVTPALIRNMSERRYYERGLDYLRMGKVASLQQEGAKIRAVVLGNEDYDVLLTAKGELLDYRCSCPLGGSGEFCKHCVAAAFAWLQQNAAAAKGRKQEASHGIKHEDIAAALQQQEKATLVGWMLRWADEDEAFRRKLVRAAAPQFASHGLVAQTKQALENAMRVRRFVEYRDMRAYTAGVGAVLDEMEDLLKQGQPAAVIELAEFGLSKFASAVNKVDDSDGYMGGLRERMRELHLAACTAGPPDPVALGEKLFQLEWKSEWDEWYQSPERYAEVLGTQGLAALRKKAEAEWRKVPQVTTAEERFTGVRFRLKAIMESLARQAGDVEALVAVEARDLSSNYAFLRIAQLYREAGRHEEAMDWAQRGVARGDGPYDSSLRLFVAEEYQRRGLHADALRIAWLEFRQRPSLTSYCVLESFARVADEWEEWRGQAWTLLRRGTADGAETRRPMDGSLAVEILLYERKVEDAWQAALAAGCRDDLWLTLAARREAEHPEDAAGVYLEQADRVIANATRNRYDQGVGLLEKASSLLHSRGKSSEFDRYLCSLLMKYKLKKNLRKLVAERQTYLHRG
jgi:uncharacterized Zn finger protein